MVMFNSRVKLPEGSSIQVLPIFVWTVSFFQCFQFCLRILNVSPCFRSALELFNASKCSQAFPLFLSMLSPEFFPLLPGQLPAMLRDGLVQDDGAYIHHRFQARVGKRQPWQAIQDGAPSR